MARGDFDAKVTAWRRRYFWYSLALTLPALGFGVLRASSAPDADSVYFWMAMPIAAVIMLLIALGAVRNQRQSLASVPDALWASKSLAYIGPFEVAHAWGDGSRFPRRLFGAVFLRVVTTDVGLRLVLSPLRWRRKSWPRTDEVGEIPWDVIASLDVIPARRWHSGILLELRTGERLLLAGKPGDGLGESLASLGFVPTGGA